MIDRIKKIREDIFKTQTRFATFLNVLPQTISTYETRRALIPTDKILKLVETYNISPLWLLTGKGEMYIKDDTATLDLKAFQEEITRLKIENNLLKDLISRK